MPGLVPIIVAHGDEFCHTFADVTLIFAQQSTVCVGVEESHLVELLQSGSVVLVKRGAGWGRRGRCKPLVACSRVRGSGGGGSRRFWLNIVSRLVDR